VSKRFEIHFKGIHILALGVPSIVTIVQFFFTLRSSFISHHFAILSLFHFKHSFWKICKGSSVCGWNFKIVVAVGWL